MKPRKSDDDDVNLDSLLDTMTNVVGILLIVLVVTQLGVGEAVKRIGEAIDPAAMEQAQQSLEELQAQQQQLALLDSKDPTERSAHIAAELEKVREKTEQLETELAATQQRIEQQRDTAKKMEVEREELLRREAELRKQIEEALTQKASLQARLEDMPEQEPRDLQAKVVHLPNPRPAPKGMKPVTLLCREGKLYPLNIDGLRAAAQQHAQEVVQRLRLDRDPEKGIDPEKFVTAFNARKPMDEYFRVTVTAKGRQPWLVFERRERRGHPVGILARRTSPYQKGLQTLDPSKVFARFLVWPDSFETYLEARRVATDYGCLAGWSPQTTPAEYQAPLGGNLPWVRLPEPKPAPKPSPAKPQPAPPPRPVPVDTID